MRCYLSFPRRRHTVLLGEMRLRAPAWPAQKNARARLAAFLNGVCTHALFNVVFTRRHTLEAIGASTFCNTFCSNRYSSDIQCKQH